MVSAPGQFTSCAKKLTGVETPILAHYLRRVSTSIRHGDEIV